MKKYFLKLSALALTAFLLLSYSAPVYAATLDQSQTDYSGGDLACGNGGFLYLAQPFTPTISADIEQVDLYLVKYGTGGSNYSVEIWSQYAGEPQIKISDTQTYNPSAATGWQTITFASPPAGVSGTTYYIILRRAAEANYVAWGVSTGDTYTGDAYWSSDGSSWTAITSVDFAFKEYYTASGWTNISSVGETDSASITSVGEVSVDNIASSAKHLYK